MTLAWVFHAAFADDDSTSSPAGRTHRAIPAQERTRDRAEDAYARFVERIRAGDTQAFDELYRTFFAPLVGFAVHYGVTRAVAEEVVQETFFAIWRTREQWDVRGTVREYLFGAVRNRALDHRRHELVVRTAGERVGTAAVSGIARSVPLPDTIVTEAELRDAVDAMLAAMPTERRQVLVLRWQEDLSYPEIAAVLGVSVNAAKQQGSRAQRLLRDLLERFRP